MARFYENPINQQPPPGPPVRPMGDPRMSPMAQMPGGSPMGMPPMGEPANQTNTASALMDLINQILMDNPADPGSVLPSRLTPQQAREMAMMKMFPPEMGGDIPSPETR